VKLAEKLEGYRITSLKPDLVADQPASPDKDRGLADLITNVCSRILESEPQLVADVAAGNQDQSKLNELISKYAEEQSLRAGYYKFQLKQQVLDSLFGYGPLQPLIDDPDISDIDATGPEFITIKKLGLRSTANIRFSDQRSYDSFCRLLIIRHGGVINENDSHCRVTDPDNRLRINVTVPPRSLKYPSLSIRKHSRQTPDLEYLMSLGMFDKGCLQILSQLANSGKSIVICGKGASGKTTLLRGLIQAMPPLERVLIAESDSEIYPEKPCCLVQKIKHPQTGGNPVSLREIVSDGLTMSLDTYCIGEIVGEEAYEFIRASFSGHRCLATVHAISAEDALDRLVSLAISAAGAEQEKMLHKMAVGGIQIIIFIKEFKIEKILIIEQFDKGAFRYAYKILWQKENETAGITAYQRS
jgi:pilus assembly protein CpaF